MDKFDKVNDSGARQEFKTGSVRDLADGKGRYDLIPTYPLQRLAEHYENGAKKYGDRNWEKGQPLMRYIDSALRHAIKGILGGDQTEDHFSAVIWNIMSYMHTLHEIEAGRLPAELDNRPDRMKFGTITLGAKPEPAMVVTKLKSSGRSVSVTTWEKGGCPVCGKTSRPLEFGATQGELACGPCYSHVLNMNERNDLYRVVINGERS